MRDLQLTPTAPRPSFKRVLLAFAKDGRGSFDPESKKELGLDSDKVFVCRIWGMGLALASGITLLSLEWTLDESGFNWRTILLFLIVFNLVRILTCSLVYWLKFLPGQISDS